MYISTPSIRGSLPIPILVFDAFVIDKRRCMPLLKMNAVRFEDTYIQSYGQSFIVSTGHVGQSPNKSQASSASNRDQVLRPSSLGPFHALDWHSRKGHIDIYSSAHLLSLTPISSLGVPSSAALQSQYSPSLTGAYAT